MFYFTCSHGLLLKLVTHRLFSFSLLSSSPRLSALLVHYVEMQSIHLAGLTGTPDDAYLRFDHLERQRLYSAVVRLSTKCARITGLPLLVTSIVVSFLLYSCSYIVVLRSCLLPLPLALSALVVRFVATCVSP